MISLCLLRIQPPQLTAYLRPPLIKKSRRVATHASQVAAAALLDARPGIVLGATDISYRRRDAIDGHNYGFWVDVDIVACPISKLMQVRRLNLKAFASAGRCINSELQPV